MAEISQFGGAQGQAPSRDCLFTESMLADALDNALSPEDQKRFDAHLLTCASCIAMLADARRGAAWLEMLRSDPPEPSADLVSRILANTSVRAAAEAASAEQAHRAAIASASLLGMPAPAPISPTTGTAPDLGSARVLPFRKRILQRVGPTLGAMLQTRMAMTAAMAFFSVALTLNLLGVHITALRARDLTPSSIRRSASEANAHVVRYYESLRVVYELESRVHDLQHGGDPEPDGPRTLQSPAPADPQPDPGPGASPKNNPGSPDHKPAQPPAHDPGSSSTTSTRGSRQTNAAAHRTAPAPVVLGPILPVVFPTHAPSLKKGDLA